MRLLAGAAGLTILVDKGAKNNFGPFRAGVSISSVCITELPMGFLKVLCVERVTRDCDSGRAPNFSCGCAVCLWFDSHRSEVGRRVLDWLLTITKNPVRRTVTHGTANWETSGAEIGHPRMVATAAGMPAGGTMPSAMAEVIDGARKMDLMQPHPENSVPRTARTALGRETLQAS
ncbi:hypothetical protein F5Y13DRAFT_194991 [Hypoxylon sp. FL1857]|nr:hypothetical protein F5Y13DRAFT_194991 [Hypoxylon sp. FL1857]